MLLCMASFHIIWVFKYIPKFTTACQTFVLRSQSMCRERYLIYRGMPSLFPTKHWVYFAPRTSRIEQSWSYCTQTLLVLLRVRWCGNKPSLLLLHAGTEIKATLFADRGWQVKHKTSTKVLLLLLVLLDVCATTTVYSHRHPVNSVSNLLPNSH